MSAGSIGLRPGAGRSISMAGCSPKETYGCATGCNGLSFLFGTLALAVLGSPGALSAAELQPLEIASKSGVHTFAVEMAATPEEQAKGLMFRRKLPEGQGMLFDFHREQPSSVLDEEHLRSARYDLHPRRRSDPADRREYGAALGGARAVGRSGARGARSGRRHRPEARHSRPATRGRPHPIFKRAERIESADRRLLAKSEACIEAVAAAPGHSAAW